MVNATTTTSSSGGGGGGGSSSVLLSTKEDNRFPFESCLGYQTPTTAFYSLGGQGNCSANKRRKTQCPIKEMEEGFSTSNGTSSIARRRHPQRKLLGSELSFMSQEEEEEGIEKVYLPALEDILEDTSDNQMAVFSLLSTSPGSVAAATFAFDNNGLGAFNLYSRIPPSSRRMRPRKKTVVGVGGLLKNDSLATVG